MNAPANLKYTKSDEWFDPATGAMGLSDYAQSQLSDIVFVEILVDEGDAIEAGKAIASVESVKAASEVYLPAGGTITEVNAGLAAAPELLNKDPYGEGWMVKLALSNPAELDALMDSKTYEAYCAGRQH